eukprot:378646-Karenia_brevis.AAC.1
MLLSERQDLMFESLQLCRARHRSPILENYFLDGGRDHWQLLTRNEQKYVREYNRKWLALHSHVPAWLVYNLGDNPENRVSWTTSLFQIPTYRRGSSMMWFPKERRVMTRRERLASLGFASFPELAEASQQPMVFNDSAGQATMVGNSMHLANATMVG